RQYGISRTDTAVFESGTQSTRVTGPSEAELTGALIRISKDTKKRVLFLEGHGERGISDTEPGGLSIAKEALVKQGYDVAAVVLLPVSRHLVFHDAAGTDWDFVPLARTSARSWAETNLKGRVVSFSPKEDVQGPLPLAAALTPKKAPEDGKRRAAIVVVGNSAFASNEYINFPGNTDFLLHALGWLAEERELISITPKDPAFRPFIPNPTQERSLLYVQVFFFPVLTFLWGMTVWSRRRRL